jgi:hypothetical protein
VPAAGGGRARGVGRAPAQPAGVVKAGRPRRSRLALSRPAQRCWPARNSPAADTRAGRPTPGWLRGSPPGPAP